MFPLFFFVAFAGGLSQVAQVPGFDFPPGYTAFQFVFVLLQSAAFSGVFTGFGVARDFEGGFAKRLMLAAPRRSGIVLGYALAALLRWSVVAVLLTVIAFAVGMNVAGEPSTSSGCSRSRRSSTSAGSSGPAGSRCASARSRPGRSCRCPSS